MNLIHIVGIRFNPYSSGLAVMTLKHYITLPVQMGFNPYSSGLAVMTIQLVHYHHLPLRFNPYSSGLAVMTFYDEVLLQLQHQFQSLF